jgi:hypothetical protein
VTTVARFCMINLTCLVELRNIPNCSSKYVSVNEKGGVIRFSCQVVRNGCISNGLVSYDAIYLKQQKLLKYNAVCSSDRKFG